MGDETHYFDCDCCGRSVVTKKMKGIGYYCTACVKCWANGEHPDDPPTPEGGCFFKDDLNWMRRTQLHSEPLP